MTKNLDDLLKDFEKEAEGAISSNRPLWEGSEADEIFNVDIHVWRKPNMNIYIKYYVWRKPGMGNTLQTIAGNKISIMTATASYLETLIRKNIITEEELDYITKQVKENVKNDRR